MIARRPGTLIVSPNNPLRLVARFAHRHGYDLLPDVERERYLLVPRPRLAAVGGRRVA